MARRVHRDDERKVGKPAREALDRWLDRNGVSRREFADRLGVSSHLGLSILDGTGYVSRTHRKIIEKLTGGSISDAVLIGKKKPAPLPPPAPPPAAAVAPVVGLLSGDLNVDADGEKLAKAQTASNIQTLISLRDDPESSKNLRARCAEILLEVGEGKPRQRREADETKAPVAETDLLTKLTKLLEDAKAKAAPAP